jgi:hypothetical protein
MMKIRSIRVIRSTFTSSNRTYHHHQHLVLLSEVVTVGDSKQRVQMYVNRPKTENISHTVMLAQVRASNVAVVSRLFVLACFSQRLEPPRRAG